MPPAREALSPEELVRRYLEEKTPGWACDTLLHERKALEDLLRFLASGPRKLRTEEILAFAAEVRRRLTRRKAEPWSPRSIEAILGGVRRFLKWALQQGHLLQDLGALIVLPSIRPLPLSLSEEEVARLIEAGPRPGGCQRRDRAILELLYGTGLRGSELARLQLEDVDLREGWLLVRLGKGSKDRLLPLGERVRQALLRYLREERPSSPAQALFLCWGGRPLSRSALRRIVSHAGKHAELSRAVWPHRLRHSYATHLLRHGAPLPALQRLLGHASLASTQVYLQVNIDDLSRMIATSHPRGRDQTPRSKEARHPAPRFTH